MATMKMPKNYDALNTIANSFILLPDTSSGDVMTHLKLQKLVYYTQAWMLTLHQCAAFDEDVQAWMHGPVIPELFQRFSRKGFNPILISEAREDGKGSWENSCLGDSLQKVISHVWGRYGSLSAKALENLTHSETPWKANYRPNVSGGRCSEVISHDEMISYYSRLMGPSFRAKKETH